MSDTGHLKCPRCGKELPPSAPEGLCPACLGALNFATETNVTGADAKEALPPMTPAELAPHFPQLEILECLGRGGMGVVYKARQKSLNRLVALKLLAPERVQDGKFAARFEKEAQALALLNHPNIVTVHDFGQAGGFYFLLMEFVDGVNLRQLLRSRRLQPAEALAIVPPVCEALQYAHEHGIVHRDIKPENLLLAKDGRVKIADFGIAKMLGSETSAASISLASSGGEGQGEEASAISATQQTTMGTPQYMAPEQREQPQAADHRADIYSLGVVLYELLTGELPADKLQPPSRVRGVQIDVRLDEIVLRALEKTPALRYQTAGEFKTQVEMVGEKGREQELPAQEDITPAKSGPMPRELKLIAGWMMVQGGLALVNSIFAFISWGQIFLNLLVLHLLIGFGLLSLRAGWWRAAVAMNGVQLFASLVGVPLVLFAGATAGKMLSPWEAFRGQPVVLGAMVLIQCVLVITCSLVHFTLMRLRREGWFGPVTRKHGTAGFPVMVVVFYAGVILGICFIGMLSFRFSRDSAYLLVVGIMAVVSPFVGVMTGNALRQAEQGKDQSGLERIRGRLKALAIVAWILALPVVGFAIFFFLAMLDERGKWNPAISEAVIVPLTWLGAVLLPWAGVRLSRVEVKDTDKAQDSGGAILLWIVLFLVLIGVFVNSASMMRERAQAEQRQTAEQELKQAARRVNASKARALGSYDFSLTWKDVDTNGFVFLDLERNVKLYPPMHVPFTELGGLVQTPPLSNWLRTNGVDVLVQFTRKSVGGDPFSVVHVRGVNFQSVIVEDAATVKKAESQPAGYDWLDRNPRGIYLFSAMLSLSYGPYGAFVQTQEGAVATLFTSNSNADGGLLTIWYTLWETVPAGQGLGEAAQIQPPSVTHSTVARVPTTFAFPVRIILGVLVLGGLFIGGVVLMVWLARKNGLKGCLFAGVVVGGLILVVGIVAVVVFWSYSVKEIRQGFQPIATLELSSINPTSPPAAPNGLAMQVQNGLNLKVPPGQLVTFEVFIRHGDDRREPVPALTAVVATDEGYGINTWLSWMGKREDDGQGTNQLWSWSVNGNVLGTVPMPNRTDYGTNMAWQVKPREVLNWWQLAMPKSLTMNAGSIQEIALFRTFGSATADPAQPKEIIARIKRHALPEEMKMQVGQYQMLLGLEAYEKVAAWNQKAGIGVKSLPEKPVSTPLVSLEMVELARKDSERAKALLGTASLIQAKAAGLSWRWRVNKQQSARLLFGLTDSDLNGVLGTIVPVSLRENEVVNGDWSVEKDILLTTTKTGDSSRVKLEEKSISPLARFQQTASLGATLESWQQIISQTQPITLSSSYYQTLWEAEVVRYSADGKIKSPRRLRVVARLADPDEAENIEVLQDSDPVKEVRAIENKGKVSAGQGMDTASKSIALRSVTNHSGAISMMSKTALLPGEILQPVLRFEDGRLEPGGVTYFVTRRESSDRDTLSLSWQPFPGLAPELELAAVEQIRERWTSNDIMLLPGQASRVFTVTNAEGVLIHGEVNFKRSHSMGGETKAAASLVFEKTSGFGQSLMLHFYNGSIPEGYKLVANGVIPESLSGEAHTHVNKGIHGQMGTFSWSLRPRRSLTRDELLQRGGFMGAGGFAEEAARQINNRGAKGPILVRPGKPTELFSVTNSAGAVFKGYLELVGNKP